MIRYEEDISIETILIKGYPLLEAHWEELANNKDKIFLKPDVEKYINLQKAGIINNICVWDDKKIIGYSVVLSTPNLHYSDDVFAYVDVIYVDKNYRNSKIGIELISRTEDLIRRKGCSVLTYHTKPAHPTIEKVLERKGYSLMENIYGILLKE